MPTTLSEIYNRYIVNESEGRNNGFEVYDLQQKRTLCFCWTRRDAGRIAGALNEKENGDEE